MGNQTGPKPRVGRVTELVRDAKRELAEAIKSGDPKREARAWRRLRDAKVEAAAVARRRRDEHDEHFGGGAGC